MLQAAGWVSKPPITRPPTSPRKYTSRSGSRTTGAVRGTSLPGIGLVIRYWWAIGMIGTFTPTMAPILADQMPAAFTTTSVRMLPLSVTTSLTRPFVVRISRTRTPV